MRWLISMLIAGTVAVAAPAWSQTPAPSGTVELSQTSAAFIASGSTGAGILYFQGRSYPFTIHGLGVGGFGLQRMRARGTVYDLTSIDDFAGIYGAVRAGLSLGEGAGRVWLQNQNGVYLELQTQTQGWALSAGLDGMTITLN